MDYRPNFLQTPWILTCDNNLTPADREVYAAIDWFSQLKKGKCTASNQTIGEIANKKQGSVANSVSRLAKYGYIQVVITETHQREAIIPLVKYTKHTLNPSLDDDTLHQPMNPLSLSDDPPPSLSNEQKENILKGEKKEIPPTPLKGEMGDKVKEIYEYYLRIASSKEKLSPKRKSQILLRLKDFTLDELKKAVWNCFHDSWYSGDNERGWKANLDYVFRSYEVTEKLLNLVPRRGNEREPTPMNPKLITDPLLRKGVEDAKKYGIYY